MRPRICCGKCACGKFEFRANSVFGVPIIRFQGKPIAVGPTFDPRGKSNRLDAYGMDIGWILDGYWVDIGWIVDTSASTDLTQPSYALDL